MKTTGTQQNFCRLTRISEEQYQTALFETGYLYAESYWSKNLPNSWQMLAKLMRETKEYWKWWATQWNIRTQEAFGKTGINENEIRLEATAKEALIEAFFDSHKEESYQYIYPNQLVFMALNKKLYGNKTINRPAPVRARQANRRKNTIIE